MTQSLIAEPATRLFAKTHQYGDIAEHFLTVLAEPGAPPVDVFAEVDAYLAQLDSPAVLRMDVLGDVNTEHCDEHQQHYCYKCESCPLNTHRDASLGSCPVAGVYVHAVCGGRIRPIWLGGKLVGNELTTHDTRYVLIDNLQPDAMQSRTDQTTQLFTRMKDALESRNMSFANVARTWLYLDDILDWYDTFNVARDAFFKAHAVFGNLVPASTGVGGSNTFGTAIQASVLAAEALTDEVTIQAVPSPLQCPALDYGSSFSRAVEIASPDLQRLYISGTASIDAKGPTLHIGDIDKQIECTMDVVHAILTSRGLDWSHLTRGVAYFKDRQDFDRFAAYCKRNGLSEMPIGLVQNDVCRDDLLFELEADAIKKVKK